VFPWHLLVRIGVATLLGGTIGFERDRRGRPAGLRTHMIVALASATFMVVSTHFLDYQRYTTWGHIDVDVSRIAASIVTGIGFLGGGAIMRTGLNVLGLTTAAGLWLVGAIGMAAGSGMYVVAVTVTLLGLLSLSVLRRLEDKDDLIELRRVSVVQRAVGAAGALEGQLGSLGAQVSTVRAEHDVAAGLRRIVFEIRVPRAAGMDEILRVLSQCEGVESVQVERASL